MKNISSKLQEILDRHMNAEGFDVVDLLAIPTKVDKMVRLRTLQEALEEFEARSGDGQISYLVQLKPKRDEQPPEKELNFDAPPKPTIDGIYLPNGKLNLAFLMQNGEILFSNGDYGLARNIYRTILKSGENSGHALYWLGRCFEAENKVDEARRCYEESIAYLPATHTFRNLADVLIRLGKYHQAAETLDSALNVKNLDNKTKAEINRASGNCWLNIGKTENAEKRYVKAIELEPSSDSNYVNLAAVYLEKEKIAEAKKLFLQALTIHPENDKALAGLGSCYWNEGNKKYAYQYFAKSLEININNATAIFYLVKCAYELKNYAIAADLVRRYVDGSPVNVSLLYSLAGLYFHLGKIEEVRRFANRILEIQASHNGAKDLLKMIEKFTTISR